MIVYIHLRNGDKDTILEVKVNKPQNQTSEQELAIIPPLQTAESEVTWISIDQLIGGESRVYWIVCSLYVKMQQFYFFVLTMKEAAKYHRAVCDRKAIEYVDTSDLAILKGKGAQFSYSKTGRQLMKQSLGYLTEMRGHYDQGNVACWMALHSGMGSQARIEMATAVQEQGLGSTSPGTVQEHGDAASATDFEADHSLVQEQEIVPLDSALPGTVQEHGDAASATDFEADHTLVQEQEIAPLGSPTTGTVQDNSDAATATNFEADYSLVQEQEIVPLDSALPGTVQKHGDATSATNFEEVHSLVQEQEIVPLDSALPGTLQEHGDAASATNFEADHSLVQEQEIAPLDSALPGTLQEHGDAASATNFEADHSLVQEQEIAPLDSALPGTLQKHGDAASATNFEEVHSLVQEQEIVPLGSPTTGTVQDNSAAADIEAGPSVVTNDQEQDTSPLGSPTTGMVQDNNGDSATVGEAGPSVVTNGQEQDTSQLGSPTTGTVQDNSDNVTSTDISTSPSSEDSTNLVESTSPESSSQENNPRSCQKPTLLARLRRGFQRLFGIKGKKVTPVTKTEDHHVPLKLTDINAKVFAQEITMLEKEMFGKIGLDEILDQRWKSQERWTCSPNVTDMSEFYLRVVFIVTTEILAQKRPKQRARVMAKVIKMADRCAKIHNYNATKALLTSLRSPPIFRLRDTWEKLKRKSKSVLRHLIVLTSSADEYAIVYRHKLACKKNANSLHFLGDVLGQMNHIESVHAENEDDNIHACADVSGELQDLLRSYQDAAEGYNFPRHPGVAQFLLKTAAAKDMVDNYDLSLEREPETEQDNST